MVCVMSAVDTSQDLLVLYKGKAVEWSNTSAKLIYVVNMLPIGHKPTGGYVS